MKKLGIKFSSLFFALALVIGSTAVVCAVDTTAAETTAVAGTQTSEGGSTLTINNAASVEVGKTVTYTLYLSEATESIVGFELRLFYDSDFLEYQKNTLKFDKFDVVFFNEDIKGKIPMNYTSLNNQPLFDKKGQFLTANFKVLNGGNANISYFFTELYGENMDYLKSFRFTYDLAVDGETILKDAIPVVNADDDTLQNNQGDFINYSDGMGEENSPQNESEHVRIGSGVKTQVIDVTRSNDENGAKKTSGNNFVKYIIIFAILGLVVAAIAVAIVMVRKKNEEDNTEDTIDTL